MAKALPSFTMDNLRRVEFVVSDTDGCLSRRIRLNHEGGEIKVFCEKDAPRVAEVIKLGIPFVMISGRDSFAAARRAEEMKASFFCRKKLVHPVDAFAFLEDKFHVSRKKTLYIGDDWQDLWYMSQALVSAAPADANVECRKIANIVTKARGGEGAISDVLTLLLQAKGVYSSIVDGYIDTPPRYE